MDRYTVFLYQQEDVDTYATRLHTPSIATADMVAAAAPYGMFYARPASHSTPCSFEAPENPIRARSFTHSINLAQISTWIDLSKHIRSQNPNLLNKKGIRGN
jgi:hypothetical protein